MKTALTDFTYKELQFLLITMEEQVKDCNNKLEIVAHFDESETRNNHIKFWSNRRDIASLWATQAFNACVDAKTKEWIASN